MYKRQIAYFDLIEFGEKRGSAGFCKWEQKEGVHTLQITLNGLKRVENKKVKIFTREEDELGEVAIRNGAASFLVEKRETVVDWEWEFSEIHIPLSEGCELVAEFEVDVKRKPEKIESTPEVLQVERNHGEEGKEKSKEQLEVLASEKVKLGEVKPEEKKLLQQVEDEKIHQEEEEIQQEDKGIRQKDEEIRQKDKEIQQETEEMEKRVEEENKSELNESVPTESATGTKESAIAINKSVTNESASLEMKSEASLYSLWDCLIKTHELIHPFGTEIQYCKIGMEEILLLKEQYHLLRKNQFLLHGFYNYKYLIIGKKDADGEKYWLGVPGIYHEREKMAARMYGFEKFEGKRPSYRVGDLGFYLITVE